MYVSYAWPLADWEMTCSRTSPEAFTNISVAEPSVISSTLVDSIVFILLLLGNSQPPTKLSNTSDLFELPLQLTKAIQWQ